MTALLEHIAALPPAVIWFGGVALAVIGGGLAGWLWDVCSERRETPGN